MGSAQPLSSQLYDALSPERYQATETQRLTDLYTKAKREDQVEAQKYRENLLGILSLAIQRQDIVLIEVCLTCDI